MDDNVSIPHLASTIYSRLANLGVVGPVSAGIQIDINAAIRRTENGMLTDASLCDHNCTTTINERETGGSYTCPAAISLNSGFIRNSFASADNIITGINNIVSGIKLANENFIKSMFQRYCEDFYIPDHIALILKEVILGGKIEVNLFGGNPEMHPDLVNIISNLQHQGYLVNLTTTGRRFMRDANFFEEVMDTSLYTLALSADDFESADHIQELAELSTEELYRKWKQIPWFHGQKQKAYEAFFVAKRVTHEQLDKPKVLFNLVLHPKNLGNAEPIMHAIAKHFPGCIINPYPVQTAFIYEPGVFSQSEVELLELFIDKMIKVHTQEAHELSYINLAKRLHYWLILKAACTVYRDSASTLSNVISGNRIWQCYKSFGANRYIQISKSSPANVSKQVGGGYLGCFWNSNTVTLDEAQVWNMSGDRIGNYISAGHKHLSAQSDKKCFGCNFPRLMFDIISSELGLAEEIIPFYLALRRQYLGY